MDMMDLSPIVEEDPLLDAEELCEASEETVEVAPSADPTKVTPSDDTMQPPSHLPMVS